MDPQQELFTALLLAIKDLGYDVYDGCLPAEGTPYPFVYLADSQQIDQGTKSQVIGTIYQSIHVWSNSPKNRGTVSGMMLDIKRVCRELEQTEHYAWFVRYMNQQVLPDNTTSEPLLHGVLEVEYQFT
ncbi:MAG: hypothetical protein LIP02_13685 [Bacteroidales bacterium]|nr:hypothetical protein [Bacteroidales bacterium]MCC8177359.1 hypothetical protein [Bacteroidales bacterium]